MQNDGKVVYINTSYIEIHKYKSGNYKELMNRLSLWQQSYTGGRYKSWEAFVKDDENEILYIHKGMDLKNVMGNYPHHELKYNLAGNPSKKISLSITSPPRNDIQRNSINFLTEKKYDGDVYETQKFLCLKPGEGKTYCAINYIAQVGRTPMIFVDSIKIMNQWIDSFLKFTSIKEDEIYSIAGSASIEKLNKFKKLPYKVYIASHDTIKSYYDQAEWTNLNTLLKKLGIGIKIFDEAHVHWINIFYVDCFSKVRDNVYLTATPSRSDHNENRLYNTLFGDIQIHGLETKFNKKYIRCIAYQWNSHPSIKDKASMMNNHGFNLNAYNDYLLDEKNKDDFFSMLLEILESILAKDNEHKVAIVVNCNNMISELYKFLQNHYDKSIIGRFCGLVAVKDREKELDKQIILTTMKGFNKGVDVAGLSTLINTVNFSSETLTDQLSGRLRFNENYKSWFIDVIDMGFSQQRNNFNKRKKFLNRISKKNYIIEYNL